MLSLSKILFSYKEIGRKNKIVRPALNNLTCQISENKINALVGPNGSGKSTLFKIISTQILDYQGDYLWNDLNMKVSFEEFRENFSICFQNPSLDLLLSAKENLHLQASLYQLSQKILNEKLSIWNRIFPIEHLLEKRVATLSGGQKRAIEIFKALLSEPNYLFLDEPSTGLDPENRRLIWKLILSIKKNNPNLTIVVSTHLLDEVSYCDELLFLDRGEVVFQGEKNELLKKYSQKNMKLEWGHHNADKVLQEFSLSSDSNTFQLELNASNRNALNFNQLQESGLFSKIEYSTGDFIDIYKAQTGREWEDNL